MPLTASQQSLAGTLRDRLDTLAPVAGDRLPPERALAGLLGCSRQSLRAVLDALEAEGLLWRHQGQGTFRGARPRGRPLRDRVLVEVSSAQDLIAARALLEPQIAAEAARVCTAADAAYLRDRVAAGRRARDRAACEAADAAFHTAIAEVAGNPVLRGVLGWLTDARRRAAWQREWDRTYARVGVEAFRGLHSDQHAAVAEAVARHDPAGAEAAMRAHLDTIRSAMRADEPGPSRSGMPAPAS